METKLQIIRKHRQVYYNKTRSIIFKTCDLKNEQLLNIKLFLVGLSTRHFYSIVRGISADLALRNIFIELLPNFIHSFIDQHLLEQKAHCGCIFIALDYESLLNFIEFITSNSITSIDHSQKTYLKLTGVNLIDCFGTDRIGFSLISKWLNKKMKYENFTAYFSTLGGAYSSLGEELYFQALNAEIVSKQQLQLACEFEDPNAICKSQMFVALSYIQLCKFKEAMEILKTQKSLLNDPSNKTITDDRLKVMCIAVIKKLKFHKYMHKRFTKNA